MTDVDLRPGPETLNVVSFCAGGRGLDRALELAIPVARTVLYVERESFAVARLVAQIEAGLVAPAAVWSDVRTLNGRRWCGVVDCIIGGIPCQPHSLAGRRAGSDDERDLWAPRGARRIIAQARPLLVVIENVGGFLSARDGQVPGAERVRRDLQKLGYAVTGCIVRASDVGLPHERERVFIIGVANGYGEHDDWTGFFGAGWGRQPSNRRIEVLPAGVGLADSSSSRLQGSRPRGGRAEGIEAAERGGGKLVDAQGVGRREGRTEPELRSGRRTAGGASDEVVDADGAAQQRGCRELPSTEGAQAWRGHHGPWRPDAELVDTIGGGHDGRPEGSLGRSVGRDAEQLAGAAGERPGLRPPGPGDAAAWRIIAEDCPELLPALSRYDRFRIAMRDEGLAPDSSRPPTHLAPEARQRRAVEGGSSGWVDARTGEPVHPARLQAAAQSALRRVADVMATRIDELRMLGNGVADAQGGLAIRIGLHDLAARGSAGAAELVRLMEHA